MNRKHFSIRLGREIGNGTGKPGNGKVHFSRNGKKREREKIIFPGPGKIGNGKETFFPEREWERPFSRSRPCLFGSNDGKKPDQLFLFFLYAGTYRYEKIRYAPKVTKPACPID